MPPSLFSKTIRDARRSYLWWVGGIAAYVIMMMTVFPTLEEQAEEWQDIIELWPEGLLAAFGIDPSLSMVSPEGFLVTYFFGMMVPLAFMIFAITFASRTMAGEEEEKTMDLLLSAPIGRKRLVTEKAAALVALLVGLGAALFIPIYLGGLMVGWDLDFGRLAAACLSAVLLGVAFGSITLALAGLTGKRPMTSGIAAGLAVAAYLMSTIGSIIDSLNWLATLSPIYLYAGNEVLIDGLSLSKASILLLIAVVSIQVALTSFNRRDVLI